MIFSERTVPVNPPGVRVLSRADVWRGLERKARDAAGYVPSISSCVVVTEHDATEFDREVRIGADRYVERVVLGPDRRVVFTRLSGPVLGVITNDIITGGGELLLRFAFGLVIRPGAELPLTEDGLAELMTADYLAAVENTLAAIRDQLP